MKDNNFMVYYARNPDFQIVRVMRTTLRNGIVTTVKDIDKIILSRTTFIKYLVIDETKEKLDPKYIDLLRKLYLSGYINKIICIINPSDSSNYPLFYTIFYDSNFERNFNLLYNKLLEEENAVSQRKTGSFRRKITELLYSWGFSPNYNGFMLIVDSILFYANKGVTVMNLSKELYPYLAHKHNMGIASAELNIRQSINIASRNKDLFPSLMHISNKGFLAYALSNLAEEL